MLLVGAGGGAAARRYWPRSPVARGVLIDGRRVPDDEPGAAAWLAARREAARARTVAPPRGPALRGDLRGGGDRARRRRDARPGPEGRPRGIGVGAPPRERAGAPRRDRRAPGVDGGRGQGSRAPRRRTPPSSRARPVDARIDLTRTRAPPTSRGARSTWRRRSRPRSAGSTTTTRSSTSVMRASRRRSRSITSPGERREGRLAPSRRPSPSSAAGAGRAVNIKNAAAASTARCSAAASSSRSTRSSGAHPRARLRARARDPGRRAPARLRRRHLPGLEHPLRGRALRRARHHRAAGRTRGRRATRRWASTRR